MSKITFRADDDLVDRLEERDASKSEAMRKALRAYLDADGSAAAADREPSIDDLVRDRVDELLADRLDARPPANTRHEPQDVNVSISLEGDAVRTTERRAGTRDAEPGADSPVSGRDRDATHGTACAQCGEHVDDEHVYCPNCGEKTSKRLFCDCGDELRSDWSFCPGCGRRTAAADVLGRE